MLGRRWLAVEPVGDGSEELGALALAKALTEPADLLQVGDGARCGAGNLDERRVLHDPARRLVAATGQLLAPRGDVDEDGLGLWRQLAAALDLAVRALGIAASGLGGAESALDLGVGPVAAATLGEAALELLDELVEVAHIIGGVVELRLLERTARPVRERLVVVQAHLQHGVEQAIKARAGG